MRTRIILAIHDAIIVEAPFSEAKEAMELLQLCMSDRLEVPQIGLHYDIDVDVFDRWGQKNPAILKACGLA